MSAQVLLNLFNELAKIQIGTFYEHKNVIIFLPINLNMCFGCSKEPSQWKVLLSIHNIYFG